jgi:excinuclease ABC subunit A
MQFLSDLFLRCPECDGARFQPHVLKIRIDGKSIHDVLEMTVSEAIAFFEKREKRKEITGPLRLMSEVGLDYLRLGQPLNVLSGGESQRLKLIKHLIENKEGGALLIFDEPTTGLHFDDVAQLLTVFQRLVDEGNSLVVIEHNSDVIKCADWVVDLGPEAGVHGGQLVCEGTPETVAKCPESHTGRFLAPHLSKDGAEVSYEAFDTSESFLKVAESRPANHAITIRGAREHNLKNINVEIPRDCMVVVTGLSGSGKSTLAFDILFAEGQRRFLDSMSPYARQFVDQLEKPEVDAIEGLPPSVAIEQRVTRGGGKSTVATVTEIYHFLRLLFSKLGVQHCPDCGTAVEKQTVSAIAMQVEKLASLGRVQIFATLVKARKGFHTEVARWAERHGFETLLVDGKIVATADFEKLERFKEHTIDVLVGELAPADSPDLILPIVRKAVGVGKGTARVLDAANQFHVLSTEMNCPDCGRAFEELDPRMFSFNSPHGWCDHCRGFGEVWRTTGAGREFENQLEADLAEERAFESLESEEASPCPVCHGARINEVSRAVRIGDLSLEDLVRGAAVRTLESIEKLKVPPHREIIAKDILAEIRQRLEFLSLVGLNYLSLDRSAKTLSGGESQRIRLAAQLGSNLRGVLYVLDEPTIGLHPRDNHRLLEALGRLAGQGNSLVIVEHDEDTMRRADHIIDLGPRAGNLGGEIVASGNLEAIMKHPTSLTARFLREPLHHPLAGNRRDLSAVTGWIEITGAVCHNLKSANFKIPVNRLTVVSGISGSGKSSLVRGVLVPAVKHAIARGRKPRISEEWDSISGAEKIGAVLEVDQSPIGKTSRSTPATYIKVFDEIRKVFAGLPDSRMRGYSASRFSFNNAGGRCESCQGQGIIKLEMNFLPASYMPCEECGGRRYNQQTLEVLYNGKSIGDIMDLTVAEAAEFFSAVPKIRRALDLLVETGLGYLKLGQPSPTLSGGEAQRMKLVTQLARRSTPKAEELRTTRIGKSTLYVLEEPTIGLHTADVLSLIHVLHRLVDEGGTVVVIEHHIDLVAEADYLIDVGPEAGDEGGEIIASGTPEEVAQNPVSRTAPFLQESLSRAQAGHVESIHPRKSKAETAPSDEPPTAAPTKKVPKRKGKTKAGV